jgi:hypothetical protein
MSSNSSKAPTQPPHDDFLSKRRSCRILSPRYAQVDAPLYLIEAAAARLHLPRGYAVEHEQARSPSAYMHVSLWPTQLQRVAIGFTRAASHALVTAPASVRVGAGTTQRWGTCILVRMMGGLVAKIQVGTASRARCLLRVLFDGRCSKLWRVCGSSAGCMPPLPSTPGSAMHSSLSLSPLWLTACNFAGCRRHAHRWRRWHSHSGRKW